MDNLKKQKQTKSLSLTNTTNKNFNSNNLILNSITQSDSNLYIKSLSNPIKTKYNNFFSNISYRSVKSFNRYIHREIIMLQLNREIDKIYYLGVLFDSNYDKGIMDRDRYYLFSKYDQILYRYKIISQIGKGCYGTVLQALDYKYNLNSCAIKIFKNENRFYKSYLSEITLLQKMSYRIDKYIRYSKTNSDLVTLIYKTFIWRGHGSISMKLYNKNLHDGRLSSLPFDKIKIILIDLFEALNFLKENHIIHCDLKPENIFFIDEFQYNVVIGDFGLARTKYDKNLTYFNIQTRWYRSPEIVLKIPYSYAIDMWSIGAIMIELLVNTPVFASRNEYELFLMMEYLLGKPFRYMIDDYYLSHKSKIEKFVNYIHSPQRHFFLQKHINKIKLFLEKEDIEEINYLFIHIFRWNPDKRIQPKDALNYLLNTCNHRIVSF